MSTSYSYFTNCTECYSSKELLNQMIETGIDISRRTFMQHCNESARDIFRKLGYADHPSQGLTSAGDYHISYHRSKWGRNRCYYFRWSCIEYIFLGA